MKKPPLFLTAMATLLLAFGCETTTDPGKGGLFSYNPEAYEQRQAERQARLGDLQDEQYAQEAERDHLDQKVTEQHSKQATLKKRIAALDRELKAFRANNAAQQQRLDQLRAGQVSLKNQADALAGSSRSARDKDAEISRLQREVSQLHNELNSLRKQ